MLLYIPSRSSTASCSIPKYGTNIFLLSLIQIPDVVPSGNVICIRQSSCKSTLGLYPKRTNAVATSGRNRTPYASATPIAHSAAGCTEYRLCTVSVSRVHLGQSQPYSRARRSSSSRVSSTRAGAFLRSSRLFQLCVFTRFCLIGFVLI